MKNTQKMLGLCLLQFIRVSVGTDSKQPNQKRTSFLYLFKDMSTFVGYSMPKPSLLKGKGVHSCLKSACECHRATGVRTH